MWICEEHGFSIRRCCREAVTIEEYKEMKDDDGKVQKPIGVNINSNP
jgi:hypothetical protein